MKRNILTRDVPLHNNSSFINAACPTAQISTEHLVI